MGRALLAIEQAAERVAVDRDALAHGDRGVRTGCLGHPDRLLGARNEQVGCFGPLRRGWHRKTPKS